MNLTKSKDKQRSTQSKSLQRVQIDLNLQRQCITLKSLYQQLKEKGIVITDLGQLTQVEAKRVLDMLRNREITRHVT